MEEKKGIKVSLLSAILFFILICVIIGLALGYVVLKEKYEAERLTYQQNAVEKIENKTNSINLNDYMGTWYKSKETINQEYLKIKNIKDSSFVINVFFYRIAGMEDTIVEIRENKGTFEAYNIEKTGKIKAEMVLENNKIVLNIISSSIYGIENNTQYIFMYKTEEITCSDTEKAEINRKLSDYITIPLRSITDIEYGKDIQYKVNLISKEKNKYYVVLNAMMKEIGEEFKQIDINGQEVTGGAAISVDKVNEYYKKIFGQNVNQQELLNSGIPYDLKIKDGILYGSYPTGLGINPFELKVKTIDGNIYS